MPATNYNNTHAITHIIRDVVDFRNMTYVMNQIDNLDNLGELTTNEMTQIINYICDIDDNSDISDASKIVLTCLMLKLADKCISQIKADHVAYAASEELRNLISQLLDELYSVSKYINKIIDTLNIYADYYKDSGRGESYRNTINIIKLLEAIANKCQDYHDENDFINYFSYFSHLIDFVHAHPLDVPPQTNKDIENVAYNCFNIVLNWFNGYGSCITWIIEEIENEAKYLIEKIEMENEDDEDDDDEDDEDSEAMNLLNYLAYYFGEDVKNHLDNGHFECDYMNKVFDFWHMLDVLNDYYNGDDEINELKRYLKFMIYGVYSCILRLQEY